VRHHRAGATLSRLDQLSRPSNSPSSLATAAILIVLAAALVWNAATYPPSGGYDATEHIAYANLLIQHGETPARQGRTEYYTPPGFYAVAGAATWLGRKIGLPVPYRLAQFVNAALVFATALLVLSLARSLLPDNPAAQIAALAFFCFIPVVTRLTAMFHPEPLDMFLTTLSLVLCVQMLRRRSFGVAPAAILGLTLGLGQLVRAFSLWTFVVVFATLAAAAIAAYADRRAIARTVAVMVAAAAVVAGPWYARQALHYSNPIFDRPTATAPLWRRRPLSFYLGLGLPTVFTNPARPSFINEAVPTTYSDLWGDWEGYFAWGYGRPPARAPAIRLAMQNALGIVPTTLAIIGWITLLAHSLRSRTLKRDPAPLAIALLPGAALLGYLYFTVSYPTPTGNVLKASYMLTAAPAWALAFGYTVNLLRRRTVILMPLAAIALVGLGADLPFLFYRL
jgi:hypothetical protein